jgi:hypothetical protein
MNKLFNIGGDGPTKPKPPEPSGRSAPSKKKK